MSEVKKTISNSKKAVKDTDVENERLSKGGLWSKPAPWMLISGGLLAYMFFSQRYDFELNIVPKGSSAKIADASAQQSTNNKISSLSPTPAVNVQALQSTVIPAEGMEIPIRWGDLGRQMVQSGVIDENKFRKLFGGKLSAEEEAMLTGSWDQEVKINQQNSRFLLDLFWALGLGNKNPILTEGEMANEKYGGAGNFASTGGWTLAKGQAMDHYSKYSFIELTTEQQNLVDEVSRNIYRPCCGNSTHFPDCNHGMAMLGLLELMASQGATEKQMYDTALAVNSYWFPQTYIDLATYFQEQGQSWDQVESKIALGREYSSGQGYATTRKKIKSLPQVQSGGGGCGV